MILAIGNPVYDEILLPTRAAAGRVLSGCSVNAALALARLGRPTTVWGSIGRDRRDQAIAELLSRGVRALLREGPETGGFRLTYPADGGERTLEVLGQADPVPDPPADLVASADAVVVGPILGEVGPSLVRTLKRHARGPMFLDPQGLLRSRQGDSVIGRIQDGLQDLLPLFDVVKPNEHEATLLTGIDATRHPGEAARRLHDLGAPLAVVTLAERGSVIFDGRRTLQVPPHPADAIDPTGAGDTYLAGFLHEYLSSGDPFRAGLFGSAVASVMVEHVGPDFPLTPDLARERFDCLLRGSRPADGAAT